jgi:hypothetical protein
LAAPLARAQDDPEDDPPHKIRFFLTFTNLSTFSQDFDPGQAITYNTVNNTWKQVNI